MFIAATLSLKPRNHLYLSSCCFVVVVVVVVFFCFVLGWVFVVVVVFVFFVCFFVFCFFLLGVGGGGGGSLRAFLFVCAFCSYVIIAPMPNNLFMYPVCLCLITLY